MFNVVCQLAFIGPGGPEFLVVMLVLLLMFGAKDAPRIFRKLNEMINQLRNTADSFKREVMYGDLNSESKSDASSSAGDNAYDDDHDDDYDYGEEYLDEEEERGYSDETFQGLEDDLEASANEPVPEPEHEEAEDEDGDAQKN
jgi:Sec-independent protein translocase protein TatA